MKKQLLLLVAMLLPMVASADPIEIDGICFNLIPKAKSAEVTKGNYSGNIVIPETIVYEGDTYQVEGIGEYAFGSELSISNVISVVIPKSIKHIEQGAFAACKNLETVYLSSIEAWCGITFSTISFSSQNQGYMYLSNPLVYAKHLYINGEEVDKLIIPDGVEEIKDYAFLGCSCVKTVTISNSVKHIGNYAFMRCTELTSIDMLNGVESIGRCAFSECSSLLSIKIPNGITTIAGGLFEGCSALENIELPNTVEIIEYNAFEGCNALTSFHMPAAVKKVEDSAFQGCTNLNKITIDDLDAWCNIEFAFAAMYDQTSTNPLYYTHQLFLGDKEVTEVVVPDNVKSLGFNFAHCPNITKIVLPSTLEIIGPYAFLECSGLTSIEIPQSVSTIGRSAFNRCSGLTEINIPQNVKTIETATFLYCTGLSKIIIPEGVTYIGTNAFRNCNSLQLIKLPSTVNGIDSYAFSNCPAIKDVYCINAEAPNAKDPFKDSYINYATLHVPESSIELYKKSETWKDFGTIIALTAEEYNRKKCEKPTISYVNGQLSFASETEGAEFVTDITDSDIKRYYDANIQLTANYTISVYATKAGYDNSDIATATLCWIDVEPKTEGDINGIAQVAARAVLIQAAGGVINVQGCDDGEQVGVYSINGSQVGTAVSQNGAATVNTTLKPGSVAIIKVGEKSIKVVAR